MTKEKNNQFKALHYIQDPVRLENLRNIKVKNRGNPPAKKQKLADISERGYDVKRKDVYEKLLSKEWSISEQSKCEDGEWRSTKGYQVILNKNGDRTDWFIHHNESQKRTEYCGNLKLLKSTSRQFKTAKDLLVVFDGGYENSWFDRRIRHDQRETLEKK